MSTISKTNYFKRRQALKVILITSFNLLYSRTTLSQTCSKVKISKLKTACLGILNDIVATIETGDNKLEAAKAIFIESAVPSFKCTKGGYDLLQSAFTTCNPLSPTLNPVLCAGAILELPDTIEDCKMAVSLISKTIQFLSEAKYIFGTAEIAFSDQGGDAIADKLKACGDPACADLGRRLTELAHNNAKFVEETKEKVTNYRDRILKREADLKACMANNETCSFGNQIERPKIENTGEKSPDIVLD